MSEFLQAELGRRDPARRAEVHRRASEWCDAHQDPDGAVSHAVLSGDLSRAESMVPRWHPTVATVGRQTPPTERWVAMFADHELEQRPLLMVMAAWANVARGQSRSALHWLARAAEALPDSYPTDRSQDNDERQPIRGSDRPGDTTDRRTTTTRPTLGAHSHHLSAESGRDLRSPPRG
jgi:ATP/maltotriose-dependent transcriptional regulator MalT